MNFRDMQTFNAIMQAISNTVPIIVIKFGDEGIILYATIVAEQMFGYYVVGECRGMSIETLIPGKLVELNKTNSLNYEHNKEIIDMGKGKLFNGKKKDGTFIHVCAALSASVIEGEKYAIATILNVSEELLE